MLEVLISPSYRSSLRGIFWISSLLVQINFNSDSKSLSNAPSQSEANRRAYDASTNPYGCEGTPIANRLSNCRQVFIDNNLVYYILIYDIVEELSKTDVTTKYDSGTIEYLKTLRKYSKENYEEQKEQGQSNGYIVGVFYKNGKYRYASIPLYSED